MTEMPKGNWNQTWPGASWTMNDVPLAKQYPGMFAVAFPNQLIVVGDDEDEVRARAAAKLGLPIEDVLTCNIAPLETRVPIGWR